MRIHYIASSWDLKLSGVGKKILGQCNALRMLGMEVKLIVIGGSIDNDSVNLFESEMIEVIECPEFRGNTILSRGLNELIKSIIQRRVISDTGRGIIVYMRYPCLDVIPKKRESRLIVEHQAKEPEEWRLGTSFLHRLLYPYEMFFGRMRRAKCDGMVSVTGEIMGYETSLVSNSIPSIVISNGIDVERVKPRRNLPENERIFRMVSLSNLWPWHGLDRIIRSMAEYNGPFRIELLVAGDGVELLSLKDLCASLGIEDQVRFIGTVDSVKSRKLFEDSNLAIGTLALSRHHMEETCSLKHREYCAAGIPFIYAGRDPDFPIDFPYAIKVNEEGEISLDRVVEAVKSIEDMDNHIIEMRAFAERNLDWKVKMKSLVSWIEDEFGQQN